jgi:hypothetical protein
MCHPYVVVTLILENTTLKLRVLCVLIDGLLLNMSGDNILRNMYESRITIYLAG